jgi:hypothetical protein
MLQLLQHTFTAKHVPHVLTLSSVDQAPRRICLCRIYKGRVTRA